MRSFHRYLLTGCLLAALGVTASLAAPKVEKGNVDELRFGASVDAESEVPASAHAKKFLPDTPIYVSMRVQEAPKGTKLMLSILDRETEELVWSEAQDLPGGHAKVHFTLPAGALKPGKYRGKVKIADDWVAEHEFDIPLE